MTTPSILEPQCEWTADQLSDDSTWTEVLDDVELDELDAALRHALAVSHDVLDIDADDFPLPSLHRRLAAVERELIDGRGFVRLRGIDRSRYTQAEMEMIYWGIGRHLGTPWPQNHHGHVLGDVTDQGKGADDPTARGNEIGGSALPFHCDGSDLVGLMCLATGVDGGLSAVANSVRVHNQLVREDPGAAAELYRPQPYDFRGEQPPGGRAWYQLPVFTEWDGRLFVRCIPPYILASQRHDDAPRLTETARAALARVVELANDPANHVTMELRPGDMQFINNFHVMHARTAYRDDRSSGRVRHLKRLWLETEVLADRPPHFRRNVSSHWNERRSASRMTVG
jgi:alpha-ketoglutarate-dependent taurine dioxygenase